MAMKPSGSSGPKATPARVAAPRANKPKAPQPSPMKVVVPQSAKAPVPPAPRKTAPVGDKILESALKGVEKIGPKSAKQLSNAKKLDQGQKQAAVASKAQPKRLQKSNVEMSKSVVEKARDWKNKTFGTTRKKVHQALAEDSNFLKTKHATPENIRRMKAGKAPLAPKNEQLGKRKAMELDHKWERRDGVKENRVDNLRLVSPLKHKAKIMRKFHKAAGTEIPKDLRDPAKYQKPSVSRPSSAQKLKKPFKLI